MTKCHVKTYSFNLADVEDGIFHFLKYLIELILGATAYLSYWLDVHHTLLHFRSYFFTSWNQFQFWEWSNTVITKIWVLWVFIRATRFHLEYAEVQRIYCPSFPALLSYKLGVARPYSLAHFQRRINLSWFVAVKCDHTSGISQALWIFISMANPWNRMPLPHILELVLHRISNCL